MSKMVSDVRLLAVPLILLLVRLAKLVKSESHTFSFSDWI